MSIGRGGTDAGGARRLGNGEPTGPLLADQAQGGLDQRLAQIAVMIAAPPAGTFRPIRVRRIYIKGRNGAAEISSYNHGAAFDFAQAEED